MSIFKNTCSDDFESYFSGAIKQGDLIAIANESYIELGFYVGRGPTGTLQYHHMRYLAHLWNSKSDINPVKSYINAPHSTRVILVHPDCLDESNRNDYEAAMNFILEKRKQEQNPIK